MSTAAALSPGLPTLLPQSLVHCLAPRFGMLMTVPHAVLGESHLRKPGLLMTNPVHAVSDCLGLITRWETGSPRRGDLPHALFRPCLTGGPSLARLSCLGIVTVSAVTSAGYASSKLSPQSDEISGGSWWRGEWRLEEAYGGGVEEEQAPGLLTTFSGYAFALGDGWNT